MEHCVINGKRCSKCCEVLILDENKNIRDNINYAIKNGIDHIHKSNPNRLIFSMLRKISKRRAKKINPPLVKEVRNKRSYYTCKNLTSKGCGIYDNRPLMCSGYPYYGLTPDEFAKTNEKPIYNSDCTYFIKL